jgi:uncharacterized RDD family membrane protein YckC
MRWRCDAYKKRFGKIMEYSKLNLAGQGTRLINCIIDMVCIFIIWLLFSAISLAIVIYLDYFNIDDEQIIIIPALIILPIFWGYYILTEFLFQQTLGKVLTKTMVVTIDGNKPSIGQFIGRTLSRSIPFEYFSYLATASGLHDQISGTRVIRK